MLTNTAKLANSPSLPKTLTESVRMPIPPSAFMPSAKTLVYLKKYLRRKCLSLGTLII